MIRLRRDDFDDPHELAKFAATARPVAGGVPASIRVPDRRRAAAAGSWLSRSAPRARRPNSSASQGRRRSILHEVPLSQDELEVTTLGERTHASPLPLAEGGDDTSGSFVPDDMRVLRRIQVRPGSDDEEPRLTFEIAGPRRELYFDPEWTTAAIVTCGGLCPGLNNVIRSASIELSTTTACKQVLGIRNGYLGLNPASGLQPLRADARLRRPHPQARRHGAGQFARAAGSEGDRRLPAPQSDIDILFCVGGDGTQRGAHGHLRRDHAPQAQHRGGRRAEDDRQRHPVRLPHLRLRHRAGEGRARRSARPTSRRRGPSTASAW